MVGAGCRPALQDGFRVYVEALIVMLWLAPYSVGSNAIRPSVRQSCGASRLVGCARTEGIEP